MLPIDDYLPVIDYKYSITVLPEVRFNNEKEGEDGFSSFTKYITSIIINRVHVDIFKYKGSYKLYIYDEYEYYNMELKHGEYKTFENLCSTFCINTKIVLNILLNDIIQKYKTDTIDNEISLYDNLVVILNTTRNLGVPMDVDVNKLQSKLIRGIA